MESPNITVAYQLLDNAIKLLKNYMFLAYILVQRLDTLTACWL